jgi:LysM repeat protein
MKHTKILLLLTVLVATLCLPSGKVQSATPSAYDLIAAVNELRANNGLSDIPIDAILMSAAQTQSDYLAVSCNQANCDGHVGAGGTHAKDRAVAAGYVLEAGMNVIECWAGRNPNATLADIIYGTWADEEHMAVMLNPDAIGVGAGVTVSDDGYVYYVLDVAVSYGSGGSGASVSATIPTTAATAQVALVQVATPQPDGSIVHVVQSGQALWNIAAAYDVTVDQLKQLNGLTSDIITTGEEIKIQGANTPTPSPEPSATPRQPTRTPVPAQAAQAVGTPQSETSSSENNSGGFLGMDRQSMGLVLILICGAGLALVVLGSINRDKGKKQPPKSDE